MRSFPLIVAASAALLTSACVHDPYYYDPYPATTVGGPGVVVYEEPYRYRHRDYHYRDHDRRDWDDRRGPRHCPPGHEKKGWC